MTAVVLAVGLGIAGVGPMGGGVAGASPREEAAAASLAPAINRVQRVYNQSLSNTNSAKTVTAMCPLGMQVTGGHGETQGAGGRITLTRLEPIRRFSYDSSGNLRIRYGYRADAATPYANNTDSYPDWAVTVDAMCIDPTPGYHIAKATTPASPTTRQNASVACADGERVLGTGASIGFYSRTNPDGTVTRFNHGIGLQVAMAASDGTYARARASVVPGGYNNYPWQVTAYAVCADRPGNYKVVNSSSDREAQYLDGRDRVASAECGYIRSAVTGDVFRTLRLSAGGGLSDNAPVEASMTAIFPARISPENDFVSNAWGHEIVPTAATWHVTAQVICAGGYGA